jgi:hypothetical protein
VRGFVPSNTGSALNSLAINLTQRLSKARPYRYAL